MQHIPSQRWSVVIGTAPKNHRNFRSLCLIENESQYPQWGACATFFSGRSLRSLPGICLYCVPLGELVGGANEVSGAIANDSH